MNQFDYRAILREIEKEPTDKPGLAFRVLPFIAASVAVLSFGVVVWFAYSEGLRMSRSPSNQATPERIVASDVRTKPVTAPQSDDSENAEVYQGVRDERLAVAEASSATERRNSNSEIDNLNTGAVPRGPYESLRGGSVPNNAISSQEGSPTLQNEIADPMADPTSPLALQNSEKGTDRGATSPGLPSVTDSENPNLDRYGLVPGALRDEGSQPPSAQTSVAATQSGGDSSDANAASSAAPAPLLAGAPDRVVKTPATETSNTAQSTAPQTPQTPQETSQVAVKPQPKNPAVDLQQSWRIQVAALPSERAANDYWQRSVLPLVDKILGNKEVQFSPIRLDGGKTYYRVRSGPFESREAATAVCVSLRARGVSCIIVSPGA